MNAIDVIEERRSFRANYSSEPVSREALRAIMEAGLSAPSGCNKQTTCLIAVDDSAVLKKIGDLVGLAFVKTAPAMICVLTERIFAYRDKCYSVQDYSAAIENMLLASVELGFESCWLEGQITDEDKIGRKIADLLNVPQDMELVCILPVGKPEKPFNKPDKKHFKKPFEERAWFGSYKGQ